VRRGSVDFRLALSLLALALAAALLLPFAVRHAGRLGIATDTAALWAQSVAARTALQDTLQASRRTAIVRAAQRVAPATDEKHVAAWIGYAISGSLLVTMDDGTELVIEGGDGYEIPGEFVIARGKKIRV